MSDAGRGPFAAGDNAATNDRIAERLVISSDTVKSHVKHILRKLRAENRAEAIAQYLRVTLERSEA